MVKTTRPPAEKRRCPWGEGDPLYMRYHDAEWGVPCRDAGQLFELLVLEGMQAGLSWITILKKRRHMRDVFAAFDAAELAALGEADIERLLEDPGIIRHRGKVTALRSNAEGFLALDAAEGAVDYFWSWVGGAPVQNGWRTMRQVPATTELATRLSKDLKKRGFRFVGPTICYAFMQSAGLVNDHLVGCFRHAECAAPDAPRTVVD
jgi:DNA-3-methyladenine glycosylase I